MKRKTSKKLLEKSENTADRRPPPAHFEISISYRAFTVSFNPRNSEVP
jgi:hypothetical protein